LRLGRTVEGGTYAEREEDRKPAQHVSRRSLRVNRKSDIGVKDRLEVACKAVADTSTRDVESEVSGAGVVSVCEGKVYRSRGEKGRISFERGRKRGREYALF
jgi:hypothetical protein